MAGILSEDDLRFVRMCKALGNPVRFKIVEELASCQPCMFGNVCYRLDQENLAWFKQKAVEVL